MEADLVRHHHHPHHPAVLKTRKHSDCIYYLHHDALGRPLAISLGKKGGRKALCVEAAAHSSTSSHSRGGNNSCCSSTCNILIRILKRQQHCNLKEHTVHQRGLTEDGEIYILHSTSGDTCDRSGILSMNSSVLNAPPLMQLLTEERMDTRMLGDFVLK